MRVVEAPSRRGQPQPPTTRPGRRGSPDLALWRSVFDRIRRSPFADQLGGLRFEVRGGVVQLQGQVARREDPARLVAVVWSVPGVAGVRDELTFCGETPAELARPRCSQATMRNGRR